MNPLKQYLNQNTTIKIDPDQLRSRNQNVRFWIIKYSQLVGQYDPKQELKRTSHIQLT